MRHQPPIATILLAMCLDQPQAGQRKHKITNATATISIIIGLSIIVLLAAYGFMCFAVDTIGFYSYDPR